ncbi:hypothetical protein LTR28_006354 [Elasticomyces elasticus]|nr:hypothetical protein LTR28_006354 [Elasticomyces elasticus]
MSGWIRPRNLVIGGGLLAAVLFVPKPESMKVNVFQTPGQKNIGDAFSRGGGSDVHTPGVATQREHFGELGNAVRKILSLTRDLQQVMQTTYRNPSHTKKVPAQSTSRRTKPRNGLKGYALPPIHLTVPPQF